MATDGGEFDQFDARLVEPNVAAEDPDVVAEVGEQVDLGQDDDVGRRDVLRELGGLVVAGGDAEDRDVDGLAEVVVTGFIGRDALDQERTFPDVTGLEMLAWAPLLVGILVLGLYPKIVLDTTQEAVTALAKVFGG